MLMEWVAECSWNQWQNATGIRTQAQVGGDFVFLHRTTEGVLRPLVYFRKPCWGRRKWDWFDFLTARWRHRPNTDCHVQKVRP